MSRDDLINEAMRRGVRAAHPGPPYNFTDAQLMFALAALLREDGDEIIDLKKSVIAFCGPWAAQYAREWGLPDKHLHPQHYDILEKCGARMDDYVRALIGKDPQP